MIKNFIRTIHLWLGLASGVIVLIISLTGCIYVFSREFKEWGQSDLIYVENPAEQQVSVSRAWQEVEHYLGEGKSIGWANVYQDPRKSWVFYSYQPNEEATTYFGVIDHYLSVYVNPYNGEILGTHDEKMDFFNIVKYLHWSLLLKTSIGQPIVGWSTLIFVILLVTGLVLWWPKSFKSTRNLFWIRWRKTTSVRKKNYDLHNVLGFYSLFIGLIIALTGMVWSFKWFQALVYVIAAGTTTPPNSTPVQSSPAEAVIDLPMDMILAQTRKHYPNAAGYRLVPASDSLAAIQTYVQVEDGLYYKTHQLDFDQYTGELLKERKHEEKNTGEKLITANYDIHTGAILGLPGKIIAFLVSLFCASLPVTGFLVWWNKRKTRSRPLFY